MVEGKNVIYTATEIIGKTVTSVTDINKEKIKQFGEATKEVVKQCGETLRKLSEDSQKKKEKEFEMDCNIHNSDNNRKINTDNQKYDLRKKCLDSYSPEKESFIHNCEERDSREEKEAAEAKYKDNKMKEMEKTKRTFIRSAAMVTGIGIIVLGQNGKKIKRIVKPLNYKKFSVELKTVLVTHLYSVAKVYKPHLQQ